MATELDAKAVVVWSQRGGMASYLCLQNFRVPIIACTSSPIAARRMAILGGVRPLCVPPPASGMLADWTTQMEQFLVETGIAREGDAALLIAGKPLGSVKAQDAIAVLRIGDPSSGFRSL
jgi:pyruvate kinase